MHRRIEAELRGFRRHVVHAPVSDEQRAGDAVRRHVSERGAQRVEQPGTVGLAVSLSGLDHAHFQARDATEPLRDGGAHRFGLLLAVAEILARALVDHHDGDGGQRLAVFARAGPLPEAHLAARGRPADFLGHVPEPLDPLFGLHPAQGLDGLTHALFDLGLLYLQPGRQPHQFLDLALADVLGRGSQGPGRPLPGVGGRRLVR